MKRPLYYLYTLQSLFILPSLYYWYEGLGSLNDLNAYSLFPLLGLLAFTIMWGHLMLTYLRYKRPELFDYKTFYRQTSRAVLVLILLHPFLLFYKAMQDNFEVLDYAGVDGRIFILFGSLSLVSFLIYEVVERLRNTDVMKRNWQYVVAMNRAAFILIYVHGLQLGQHLQSGPLRTLWLFFGISTIVYFIWAFNREIRRDSVSDN